MANSWAPTPVWEMLNSCPMLYKMQAAFMAIVHIIPSKLHMLLSHQKRGLLLMIVLNASVITSSKSDKDSRGKGNLNLGNISTKKN